MSKIEPRMIVLSVPDITALQCMSGSGAFVEGIVAKNRLPEAFRRDDFRQFRVAGEKKITLDVTTGNYATGPKDKHLLFSYDELAKIGDIPNAKYLQFVPEGTSYSVLDFDTDKSLSTEKRTTQVDYIVGSVLKQFDGRIEYSASGLGIHAYIEDRGIEKLNITKVIKTSSESEVGKIDLEIFTSKEPIILTGNYVDKSSFDFDVVPKKIMVSITEKVNSVDTPSTEKEVYAERIQFNFDNGEIEEDVRNRFEVLDKNDQYQNGYPEGADLSHVDLYMAKIAIEAGFTPDQAYTFVILWMGKHREKSIHPLSGKAIENKAGRAVAKALKIGTTNTPEPTPATAKKTMKEIIMERKEVARKARETAGKSKSLIHNVIYNGTLNVIFAKSGSGKTKMAVILTMEMARKHPEKIIYYFAADLSNDDVAEIAEIVEADETLSNFVLDQDMTGESFMSMIDESVKSEGVEDLVFVVDTLKKITAVNNKDGMSKTFARLKKATARGATGIIIAHTNKDGITMSGTAEVEQDSDNVLTVEAEYIGEDNMKATLMAAPGLRCRSRIEPLTLEIARDGFDYKIVTEPVNVGAMEAAQRENEHRGNLIDIAQDVVNEYFKAKKPLTKTALIKEIKSADAYTGNRNNVVLSKMIDRLDVELFILLQRSGRAIHCVPFEHPVHILEMLRDKPSTEKEIIVENDDNLVEVDVK